MNRQKNTPPAPPAASHTIVAKHQGTRAFQELLSNDPQLAQDVQKTQDSHILDLAQATSIFAANKEISSGLARLRIASPEKMLRALALVVRRRQWFEEVRLQRDRIKSLARKLRIVADLTERLSGDAASYAESYPVALQLDCDPIRPASERVPCELLVAMRSCADDWDAEVRKFGILLKDVIPAVNRKPLVILLESFYHQTRDVSPRNLQILAEMLAAAHECFGFESRATADSLRQTFIRHVRPR